MDTELQRVLDLSHKEAVLETVQQLPSEASFDEILEKIALLAVLHRNLGAKEAEREIRKEKERPPRARSDQDAAD